MKFVYIIIGFAIIYILNLLLYKNAHKDKSSLFELGKKEPINDNQEGKNTISKVAILHNNKLLLLEPHIRLESNPKMLLLRDENTFKNIITETKANLFKSVDNCVIYDNDKNCEVKIFIPHKLVDITDYTA